MRDQWEDQWRQFCRNSNTAYSMMQPSLSAAKLAERSHPNRKLNTLNIRYLFGHANVNSYRLRMGLSETDTCDCNGDTDDLNHWFFNCRYNELATNNMLAALVTKGMPLTQNHISLMVLSRDAPENRAVPKVSMRITTLLLKILVFPNLIQTIRLRLVAAPMKDMKEIDFFMASVPSEEIDYILGCTNANLREKRKQITKEELYKAIGLMYAMTLSICHTRRDYWSNEDGVFVAPAFGKRFGMGIHRFEEILSFMSFSKSAATADDKWHSNTIDVFDDNDDEQEGDVVDDIDYIPRDSDERSKSRDEQEGGRVNCLQNPACGENQEPVDSQTDKVALDPTSFDCIVECTKTIGRYDLSTYNFGATSLASYMGTEPKVCTDVIYNMTEEKPERIATFVQPLLLNRRRVGELQRMTLSSYISNIRIKLSDEFLHCIKESERCLIRALTLSYGVEHGSIGIYKHVRLSDVKNPRALTSTKLCKHLATMSDVINLSE
nr:unnamed protein product [Callosobruchus analis]